jgi:hypothetical protein
MVCMESWPIAGECFGNGFCNTTATICICNEGYTGRAIFSDSTGMNCQVHSLTLLAMLYMGLGLAYLGLCLVLYKLFKLLKSQRSTIGISPVSQVHTTHHTATSHVTNRKVTSPSGNIKKDITATPVTEEKRGEKAEVTGREISAVGVIPPPPYDATGRETHRHSKTKSPAQCNNGNEVAKVNSSASPSAIPRYSNADEGERVSVYWQLFKIVRKKSPEKILLLLSALVRYSLNAVMFSAMITHATVSQYLPPPEVQEEFPAMKEGLLRYRFIALTSYAISSLPYWGQLLVINYKLVRTIWMTKYVRKSVNPKDEKIGELNRCKYAHVALAVMAVLTAVLYVILIFIRVDYYWVKRHVSLRGGPSQS